MSHPELHPRRRARQGSTAIIVALAMVVLLGSAALVVDMGWLGAVQAELQAAADAGAHAGARQLDGSDAGLARAEELARSYAGVHRAGGEPADLDGGDGATLELGVWDGLSFAAGGAASEVNAVRTVARRADLTPWFSGAAFGIDALAASAEAIAVHARDGAGEAGCFLPLAVADCTLTDLYTTGVESVEFTVNPPSVDNVGWAMPGGSPSASWLREQLRACTWEGTVAVGDDVGLNNGAAASVLDELADILTEGTGTRWDTALWGPLPAQLEHSGVAPEQYGTTLEGPILTFTDPTYCEGSGGGFTGHQDISGFVWAAIYDVVSTGPVAQRTVRVRLETTQTREVGSGGGGPDFGVVGRDVVMVR